MLGNVVLRLLRRSYLNVGLSLSVFLEFALLELSYSNVSWVFFNFTLQLFPLGRSIIRPWYKLASNFPSSRVRLDPSPLAHLRDVFFKGPLFAFWPLGVAQPSLPCFVDATISRVAGISGQGGFAFSLPAPRPIFEAEFFASFYGIVMYRPISNNIHLIGDNSGVLFCLKFRKI